MRWVQSAFLLPFLLPLPLFSSFCFSFSNFFASASHTQRTHSSGHVQGESDSSGHVQGESDETEMMRRRTPMRAEWSRETLTLLLLALEYLVDHVTRSSLRRGKDRGKRRR